MQGLENTGRYKKKSSLELAKKQATRLSVLLDSIGDILWGPEPIEETASKKPSSECKHATVAQLLEQQEHNITVAQRIREQLESL